MLAEGAIYTDQEYHLRKDKEHGLGFFSLKNLLAIIFLWVFSLNTNSPALTTLAAYMA